MQNNWPTKKIGESVYFQEGPGLRTFQFKPAGIRVINVANVREGFLDLLKTKFLDPAEVKQKYKHFLVKEGDILVSTSGTIGRVAWVEKENLPLMLNTSVVRFHALDEKVLLNRFLLYFLSGSLFRNELLKYKTGVAIFNVGPSHIKKIKIPLPPLETQKQIVERLDKIAETQKLNDELIQKTDELFQSLLHKELNPAGPAAAKAMASKKDWEIKELGDVALLVRGPFGGSLRKDIFVESGDCVYEQGNVIDGDLENFRYFVTPEKFRQMKRFEVLAGDILMSCSGTIGKFVLIPRNFKKGIINQALLKITPNQKVMGEFLKFKLENYFSSNKSHVKGIAIKNIAAVKELKKVKIPLPPLETQKRIVAKLSAVQDYKKQLIEQKTKLKELFNSALSKSMSTK